MDYPRVVLAGVSSGVGKTTISLGIMLALRKRGLKVQAFKSGPDYIDPTYHNYVTGRISRNLDTWMLSKDTILELFKKNAGNLDISIIEGVMGLYDGLQDKEIGSTAYLSKILKAPVILILNCRSLSRSAGAVILGYQKFDKNVDIKGVILNNVGSINHYHYVKSSIEKATEIPVIGYLPKQSDLKLPERHLGLVPTAEKQLKDSFYKKLLGLVDKHIDINAVIKISMQAKVLPLHDLGQSPFSSKKWDSPKENVVIAVAKDKAFNFYYEDNLDILKHLGAKIIEFRPVKDKKLPAGVNGLYIGGGFPEIFARELSKNIKLKTNIQQKAEEGLPIYAECGGLMYLAKQIIDFDNNKFNMLEIFDVVVKMDKGLRALGYIDVKVVKDNILSKKGDRIRAHIFHWSYISKKNEKISFAYKVSRPSQKKGTVPFFEYDGLIKNNVLASYTHLHFASNMDFAKNFIRSCKNYGGER